MSNYQTTKLIYVVKKILIEGMIVTIVRWRGMILGSISSIFLLTTFSCKRQIRCLFLKTNFTILFCMKNVCNVCSIFFEIGKKLRNLQLFTFYQSLMKLTPGVNFTNILWEAFHTNFFAQLLCAKGFWCKSCS